MHHQQRFGSDPAPQDVEKVVFLGTWQKVIWWKASLTNTRQYSPHRKWQPVGGMGDLLIKLFVYMRPQTKENTIVEGSTREDGSSTTCSLFAPSFYSIRCAELLLYPSESTFPKSAICWNEFPLKKEASDSHFPIWALGSLIRHFSTLLLNVIN